jgi:hypothetical protein
MLVFNWYLYMRVLKYAKIDLNVITRANVTLCYNQQIIILII